MIRNEYDLQTKRVSVRSGGAGHAHSGIVKGDPLLRKDGETAPTSNGVMSSRKANAKIVQLGR
jgi:hypothetical protein